MRKFTKRSVALVAGSVLAVSGGTAAFAYASGWFKGSSTTVAQTSSIGNVTATIDLRTGGAANNIYPGKRIEMKTVAVNNPNDFSVRITGFSEITVEGPAGCNQSTAGFSFPELTSATFAPGPSANVDLGDIQMAEGADPACAGAALTVRAKLSGEIVA